MRTKKHTCDEYNSFETDLLGWLRFEVRYTYLNEVHKLTSFIRV